MLLSIPDPTKLVKLEQRFGFHFICPLSLYYPHIPLYSPHVTYYGSYALLPLLLSTACMVAGAEGAEIVCRVMLRAFCLNVFIWARGLHASPVPVSHYLPQSQAGGPTNILQELSVYQLLDSSFLRILQNVFDRRELELRLGVLHISSQLRLDSSNSQALQQIRVA